MRIASKRMNNTNESHLQKTSNYSLIFNSANLPFSISHTNIPFSNSWKIQISTIPKRKKDTSLLNKNEFLQLQKQNTQPH